MKYYDSDRIARLREMGNVFIHPRETWSKKVCERAVKYAPANVFDERPPKGLINDYNSPYNAPGHSICTPYVTADGIRHRTQYTPVPIIPKGFGFDELSSWGTRIIKL